MSFVKLRSGMKLICSVGDDVRVFEIKDLNGDLLITTNKGTFIYKKDVEAIIEIEPKESA
jgi:hypothetical protein